MYVLWQGRCDHIGEILRKHCSVFCLVCSSWYSALIRRKKEIDAPRQNTSMSPSKSPRQALKIWILTLDLWCLKRKHVLFCPFLGSHLIMFYSSQLKRNKPANGVGTRAKFGRKSWCIARCLPTNLSNVLTPFPWEQSVSNLYHWRMMIFFLCIYVVKVATLTSHLGKMLPGRWIIWRWWPQIWKISDPFLKLLLLFLNLKLIKMEKIWDFSFQKNPWPQRSFVCCICIMLTHQGTGMQCYPHNTSCGHTIWMMYVANFLSTLFTLWISSRYWFIAIILAHIV